MRRIALIIFLCCSGPAVYATGLVTTFDQRGLATLSYNGVSLINLNAGLGDPFTLWSYVLGTDQGFGGQFSIWDPTSQTLTWTGNWGGTVTCQFVTPPNSDTLLVTLKITNPSSQALNNINIYPFGLQFPQLPGGFYSPVYPQFHNNGDGPSLISADYGSGMVVLSDGNTTPLYLGYSPSGAANHYNLVVGTMNDSTFGFLSAAVPVNRSIPPGGVDTYSFSLRFAPSGSDYHTIAGDVLNAYGQAWPQTLSWTDRRAIGELFMTNPDLTNMPIDGSQPNPRGYNIAQNINVQNASGVSTFQQAAMAYATNAVQILKSMNAQGAIVWDLEGQQYPQDGGNGSVPNACGGTAGEISYAGSPDLLPQLSPEMNGIADAFFKTFTDAGLKCGMTIRPQQIVLSGANSYQNWCPVQDPTAATTVLIQKMSYAYNRWGCTLFYVDSDRGPADALAPSVWSAVHNALPNVLIFPENIWPKDYAYTAPLASFTAPYKPLHTPIDATTLWPHALSMTYVGDAPNQDLTNNPNDSNQWNEFVQAVKNGDILSFRSWYDNEPLNGQVKQIYALAGSAGSPPPNLTLTKSATTLAGASLSTAKPGDQVIFVMHYQNTSNTSAASVVISDPLPAGVTLVSIANGGVLSGNTITWAIGNVAGNASGSVSFEVTVN